VLCIHALNLNSKFLTERNIFSAFLTIQIDQSNPADSVLHRSWKAPKKGFKNFLNFNLTRNRSRRRIFAVEKTDKALYDDQLLVFFSLQISMLNKKDIRVIDISASERQNCLLHLLSLKFGFL